MPSAPAHFTLALGERTLQVPALFYGTAWKEDRTEALLGEALRAGFRAIDTANQRKHYHEAGVGAAVSAFLNGGTLTRGDLFLQTKFTHVRGQYGTPPYDPTANTSAQVEQSFASSLEHLHSDYIDSYVLHGPATDEGLTDEDWMAWSAMEGIARRGQARLLGISNVSWSQLELLIARAEILPTFVQNRCVRRAGWDRDVRDLCRERGLQYQGFWLLSANQEVLAHRHVERLARARGRTAAQILYRFALGLGMIVLTGTTNPTHMRSALEVPELELDSHDIALIQSI